MQRYVKEARHIGAVPILVTPVYTRHFDSQGRLQSKLLAYARVMKAVASEARIPLLDLHERSGELFHRLGPQRCAELAAARGDPIHFNELGAKILAEIVSRELRRVDPALAQKLLKPSK